MVWRWRVATHNLGLYFRDYGCFHTLYLGDLALGCKKVFSVEKRREVNVSDHTVPQGVRAPDKRLK
jgi:hypothetical protein